MGIFSKNFKVDGDGHISEKEQAAAREKAWKLMCKHSDKIGFNPDDAKNLSLDFHHNAKDSGHCSVQLRDKKGKVLGEVAVDKVSGDYEVSAVEKSKKRTTHHSLEKTNGFGEHHEVKESSKIAKQETGKDFQVDHSAKGQYCMVRNRVLETTVNGKSLEMGSIDVYDPNGKKVFSAPYNAGGKGNGAPPFKDARIADHSETTTLIGGRITTKALRLADSDMKGRSGILIHEGGLQSFGCLHISHEDRQTLFAMWDKIPGHKKADHLLARDSHDRGQLASAVKELGHHGIHVGEPSSGKQIVAMSDSHRHQNPDKIRT